MKNKKRRRSTIKTVSKMIEHADKGASGFWTDDFEGCGNPLIFPEFEDGLKNGNSVKKDSCACPWDRKVMYGCYDGNVDGGCYYRCEILKATFLMEDELRNILIRFKDCVTNGDYDDEDKKVIAPLFTEDEIHIVNQRMKKAVQERKKQYKKERQERAKKAARLIKKYPQYKEALEKYYEINHIGQIGSGFVFFSVEDLKTAVGAEDLTYEEYIDIQLGATEKRCRANLIGWFLGDELGFKGQIEKINDRHVCFKRLYIDGISRNGAGYFSKEDHIWMDKDGFEQFKVGDCLSFSADVYRYLKKGDGKQIDFGLRNPWDIQKIERYDLPTEMMLRVQFVEQLVCETCLFAEKCNGFYCLRDEEDVKAAKYDLLSHQININKEIIKNVLNKAMESEEYVELFKKILKEED